jgi:predicted nucleic-acid-binding protein
MIYKMPLKKVTTMIAIDTNILVRVFIDDESTTQIKNARQLVRNAKKVFLSQVVLVETTWVLLRAYKLTKEQVLFILQEIHENAAFILENEEQFNHALTLYKKNSVDFSDCIILASTQSAAIPSLYTFDAKFAKIEGVKKL